MPRMIKAQVVRKVLRVNRVAHSLVSTPGLDVIKTALFFAMNNPSITDLDKEMIARAVELAWLEGASIISTTTEAITLNQPLPKG